MAHKTQYGRSQIMAIDKQQDEISDLNLRAKQLGNMQPQQLLAYIAALLESQIAQSKAILNLLAHDLKVTGTVKVETDVFPLKVEVDDTHPLEVEVRNTVEVEVKNYDPIEVKVDNSSFEPLRVQVTNTPLEVAQF